MPDSLKLCYGESDLPTPEFICRAAFEASCAGHTFYTHTAGYPELRQAIAAKVLELHGVSTHVQGGRVHELERRGNGATGRSRRTP